MYIYIYIYLGDEILVGNKFFVSTFSSLFTFKLL